MCLGQKLALELVRLIACAETFNLAADRLLIGADKKALRGRALDSQASAQECVVKAQSLPPSSRRIFARVVLERLSEWVIAQASGHGLAFSLYRAFDTLDDALGIDYTAEKNTTTIPGTCERLYEGAGVVVQTSYASIVSAIARVGLRAGDLWVDLGSGYGRLGLALGAMHDSVRFVGYEFVGHRARVAQNASARLEFSDRVCFVAQDLGDPNFQIPEADVYYMFDPFTVDTYARVLRQLARIGASRSVSVIAKGGAHMQLHQVLGSQTKWTVTERFDEGTLSIFRSMPQRPLQACRSADGAL